MHLLNVFALLCFVLGQCGIISAALYRGTFADKDHPGKCYINADLILDEGQTAQHPTKCGIYNCTNGERGEATVVTCGIIAVNADCPLQTDIYAAYPICCAEPFSCNLKMRTATSQVTNSERLWIRQNK